MTANPWLMNHGPWLLARAFWLKPFNFLHSIKNSLNQNSAMVQVTPEMIVKIQNYFCKSKLRYGTGNSFTAGEQRNIFIISKLRYGTGNSLRSNSIIISELISFASAS